MSLFSAIVPCYNEEENIDYFYQEFMKNEPFFRDHDLEFELLYVDDGSKDKTVEKVKELRRKDERKIHRLRKESPTRWSDECGNFIIPSCRQNVKRKEATFCQSTFIPCKAA